MTDMLANETLNYILKRIVFVNSANHAYSEIRLDSHLALFGANNAGKTASLAATKLMLYPETDFINCDKKFQFKGKAGIYSKEDSYEFYFPSNQSFLIMETQNDIGTACVVLYRAGSYRYYRIFLPLEYEAVRHLFWDIDNDCFAKDLSVDTLLAFQKKHKGIHISDGKKLTELMYSNFTGVDSRYGIVPLTEDSRKAVNAFRSIYQMAFDAGTGGTEALADAIATLIEMKRGRQQERMNADLAGLEQKYQQLLRKKEEIQCLKNNEDNYYHLKNEFETLQNRHTTLTQNYAILSKTLTDAQKSYVSKFSELTQKVMDAQKEHTTVSTKSKELDKQVVELTGSIKEIQKRIEQYQKTINVAESVLSNYEQTDAYQLAQELEGKRTELLNQKHALEDNLLSAELLEQLTREINKQTEQLEKNIATLANINQLTLTQLPEDSANVLVSLNDDFATITGQLNDNQLDTINAFTALFDINDGKLIFAENVLANTSNQKFQIEQRKTQLKQSTEALKAQIDNNKIRQKEITTAIKDTSGASRQQSIDQLQAQIDGLYSEIDALKRYDISKQDIEKIDKQLEDKLAEKTRLTDDLGAMKTRTEATNQALQTILSQRSALESQKENFENYKNNLNHVATNIGTIHHSDPQIDELRQAYIERHGEPLNLDTATVNKLVTQSNIYSRDYSTLKLKVENFVVRVPNDDIEEFTNIQILAQLGKIISAYNNSFSSLTYQIQTQQDEIRKHNQVISNQLKEISDANYILHDYIASINNALNNHQISNLKQVRLKLYCHADFDHVRKLQQSHDITNNELMSDDFYRTLMAFMEKHANKRTKLIKMRDIISKISYEYMGTDGIVTDKSQSGGTTSTITASIIAILLKRIFMNGALFKMPIIIDEIGDLDDNNTSTIIDCIDEHGFSAFCATPTQRASVCQSVKRWIRIDYNVLAQPPKISGCVLNIMPESVEVWGQTEPVEINASFEHQEAETDD